MSVINATQMWSKRGGNYTSEKYDTFANKISLTEAYQVLAEIGDDQNTIENYGGIPSYGDPHPTEPFAYVGKRDITPLGPIFWLVVISYEGTKPDAGTVTVKWTDTTSTEPIDRDWDGRAIVTAALEQVEGLTVDIADPVVVITRRFTSINTYGIAAYRRATNSDTFLGWPPGTARLVGYDADNEFKYGAPQELWTVAARIQFRFPYANTTSAQAWHKRWRHEGLYVNTTANDPTTRQRARDPMGQEVTKPVLLKLDGTQELDPDAAVFIHTQVYDSLPFSGLGLL